MKAISLWQPWASLWLTDRKVHETRHWATSHRGLLLIHAAKRFEKNIPPDEPLREILDDEFGGHWAIDLPTGALVGAVMLADCIRTDRMQWPADPVDDYWCGDFNPGRFAWRRDAYLKFTCPIPWRGRQALFDVEDQLLPELLDGLWALRDAAPRKEAGGSPGSGHRPARGQA